MASLNIYCKILCINFLRCVLCKYTTFWVISILRCCQNLFLNCKWIYALLIVFLVVHHAKLKFTERHFTDKHFLAVVTGEVINPVFDPGHQLVTSTFAALHRSPQCKVGWCDPHVFITVPVICKYIKTCLYRQLHWRQTKN